jgi:hypothetical protein
MARIARQVAMSGLAALALCVGGTDPVEAQWFQGAGYFSAGVARTATGELDDLLAARGYPRFGRSAVSVSIGGYATVASRAMFGFEWNGIIKGQQEHQGRSVFLGGGYATLGAGYAMNVSPRVRVYPRVGLGVGGLGLSFETTEASVGFDEALADPDGQADLSRGFNPSLTREHEVLDVGAGAEFLPSRNGRGTLIGLRLGVMIASDPNNWRLNRRPVTGGPAATMAGPYFRIVIGAGAWR